MTDDVRACVSLPLLERPSLISAFGEDTLEKRTPPRGYAIRRGRAVLTFGGRISV
jgi:hypothetical protein